jgi:hypothetical protein
MAMKTKKKVVSTAQIPQVTTMNREASIAENTSNMSTTVAEKKDQKPVYFERKPTLKKYGGTDFEKLHINLMNKSSKLFHANDIDQGELIYEAIYELQPQDYVEGMLCAQIATLHALGVRFLNRAMDADMRYHQDPDLNNGIKLLRLQHETLEALMRYRRKGEQKVIVQHVQVNDGGKAIVGGNMVAGGGSAKKTSEVTPCRENAEQKPEQTVIDRVVSQQWPMESVACTVGKPQSTTQDQKQKTVG